MRWRDPFQLRRVLGTVGVACTQNARGGGHHLDSSLYPATPQGGVGGGWDASPPGRRSAASRKADAVAAARKAAASALDRVSSNARMKLDEYISHAWRG